MKTLNKSDLAEDISYELGLLLVDSKKVANNIVSVIKSAIFTKKLVYIPKHLKIGSSVKNARIGRNPKTGEEYPITVRHSVRGGKGHFPNMQNKLTKSDFITELAEIGYTLDVATTLVETFYKFVGKIKDGQNRIEIRELGVFHSEYRSARTVRNPKTGETLEKEEHYTPMFKCAKSLRESMDKHYL